MVDIGEELVDQHLGDVGGDAAFAMQAMLEQEHVQRQHLETTERHIRHIPVRIKESLPRRRHDLSVQRLGDGAVGMAFAAEQALKHWGRSPGDLFVKAELLHRRLSWFTGFAASRKPVLESGLWSCRCAL